MQLSGEYDKYKDLSEANKDKFIEYLNDETLLEQIFNGLNTNNVQLGNSKTKGREVVSDDIEIDFATADKLLDSTGIPLRNSLNAENRVAELTSTVSVLGIKIFQAQATLRYQRTGYGGTITAISSSDHRITRNFTLNRVSYGPIRHYRSSTTARSESDTVISFILKGNWKYGDGRSWISVNNYGSITGDFYANFN